MIQSDSFRFSLVLIIIDVTLKLDNFFLSSSKFMVNDLFDSYFHRIMSQVEHKMTTQQIETKQPIII